MTKLLTLKETVGEALIDVERLVSRRARASVRPIYRNKGLRPDQLGTCTFVEIDSADYLVTAAHVIDGHEGHTLFVGQGAFLPITLTFRSTVPPRGNRAKDKIDFAFARVDNSWRSHGIKPLPVSALIDRADAPLYSAIGFPNSRNRKYNPVKGTVRPSVRQFISNPVRDRSAFDALGLDADVHLALRRDPKFATSRGMRINMFEPRGMSGGAIFGLYGLQTIPVLAGLEEPLIVPEAIVTEKSEEHKLLFGTRLALIVDTIRKDRPLSTEAGSTTGRPLQ